MKMIPALLLLVAAPARALQSNVGTTAAEFLRLGAGARSLGMGEAYTAVADGADAVYWNPAGLARMSGAEALYSRSELPASLHEDFLSLAVPGDILQGTLALAFTRFSQDSLPMVNASNQRVGSFSPHSEVYALAYGHTFYSESPTDSSRAYFKETWSLPRVERPDVGDAEPWTGEISGGITTKLVTENLGTRTETSAFAVDVGGLFRPSALPSLVLAGAARNLGGRLHYIADDEALPGELAASLAYNVRFFSWTLLPAIEADAPYAGNPYGKIGLEAGRRYGRSTQVFARVGYSSRSTADLGALSGIAAGVGLRTGPIFCDAAFQLMSALGESFRLSAGWRF